MKISCSQLQAHLEGKLRALYLLSGDEPFLALEAAECIRAAARRTGHSEHIRIATDSAEWINDLWSATKSLSLLSTMRLVELDLRTVRLTPTHAKTLATVVNSLPDNVMLLLVAKRPDNRGAPPAWQVACEKIGVMISIWPIKGDQLPQWILQRAKQRGISLSLASARFLAEQTEGNLSAAAQELDKLILWQDEQPNDTNTVDQALQEMIVSCARYDIFQLSDAIKSRNSLRAVKVLSRLLLAGQEPALILWAITRELRTMTSRDNQCITPAGLKLISHAAQIDRIIKGADKGRFKDEAEALLLAMTGRCVPTRITGKTHP